MSKFGVGVGDDFPVDDGRERDPAQPQDDRAEYEEWKRRRDAHRAQREEWRRQRDEWRERKRAFKERVRQAARESFGSRAEDYEHRHYYGWRSGRGRGGFPFLVWPAIGLLIPVLIIALLVSVIAAVFKSPFLFLGLVILAFLFFGYRHHHHHDDFHGRDYDFDLRPAGGPRPPQPPQPTVVVTPPPPSSAPSGK